MFKLYSWTCQLHEPIIACYSKLMTILFYFIKFKINLLINNLKLKQPTNDETYQILLRPNAQKRGRKKRTKGKDPRPGQNTRIVNYVGK